MAKSNTTKYLLIAGVAAVGYYFYTKGGITSAQTAAGNDARNILSSFVPGDAVYDSIIESLSDAQANALKAWNDAGRPATFLNDAVLRPVLSALRAAGGYFYNPSWGTY